MDDCQKFLRFVLRCGVVCKVGKNIAETSGYAVSFSLQIRSIVFSISLYWRFRRWHTVRHIMTVKGSNSLLWITPSNVTNNVWNGDRPKLRNSTYSTRNGRWRRRRGWGGSHAGWRILFIILIWWARIFIWKNCGQKQQAWTNCNWRIDKIICIMRIIAYNRKDLYFSKNSK